MAKPNKWGGKRPGAGRPGEGRETVCARVNKELHNHLKQLARTQKISLSKLIETLLAKSITSLEPKKTKTD